MNYKRFCKVLGYIEANPEMWNQYSCYDNCFMGIAATMSGCNSRYANVRMNESAKYLQMHPNHPQLAAVDLKLEYFQRLRAIYGWAECARAAA